MPSPVFPHSGRQAPGGTPNPKTGSAWGEGKTGSWGARKRWPLRCVDGLRGGLRAAPPSPNSPCGSGFQQRRVQRGFEHSEVKNPLGARPGSGISRAGGDVVGVEAATDEGRAEAGAAECPEGRTPGGKGHPTRAGGLVTKKRTCAATRPVTRQLVRDGGYRIIRVGKPVLEGGDSHSGRGTGGQDVDMTGVRMRTPRRRGAGRGPLVEPSPAAARGRAGWPLAGGRVRRSVPRGRSSRETRLFLGTSAI